MPVGSPGLWYNENCTLRYSFACEKHKYNQNVTAGFIGDSTSSFSTVFLFSYQLFVMTRYLIRRYEIVSSPNLKIEQYAATV